MKDDKIKYIICYIILAFCGFLLLFCFCRKKALFEKNMLHGITENHTGENNNVNNEGVNHNANNNDVNNNADNSDVNHNADNNVVNHNADSNDVNNNANNSDVNNNADNSDVNHNADSNANSNTEKNNSINNKNVNRKFKNNEGNFMKDDEEDSSADNEGKRIVNAEEYTLEQGDTEEIYDKKVDYTALRSDLESKIKAGYYEQFENKRFEWWFRRKKEHVPSGHDDLIQIENYNAFFLNSNVTKEDKVIYLTFDCGYENGCTATILDVLQKHQAKATFFLTKGFIQSNPECAVRMKEEGHFVGNHTLNHYAMTEKKEETIVEEVIGCAELFYTTTGYEMDPFFRPPEGVYSERTLRLVEDMGYTTIFWSIAYYDYDTKNQPGKDYVIEHFKEYHHNGAIPLIHSISKSNTEALDEVLFLLENEGYRFGILTELVN